jgi:hypothetical protein
MPRLCNSSMEGWRSFCTRIRPFEEVTGFECVSDLVFTSIIQKIYTDIGSNGFALTILIHEKVRRGTFLKY